MCNFSSFKKSVNFSLVIQLYLVDLLKTPDLVFSHYSDSRSKLSSRDQVFNSILNIEKFYFESLKGRNIFLSNYNLPEKQCNHMISHLMELCNLKEEGLQPPTMD